MGKAKDIVVTRTKHGESKNVRLGSLSHNELCSGIAQQITEIQNLKIALNDAYMSYANHLASQDVMSKEEWLEFIKNVK